MIARLLTAALFVALLAPLPSSAKEPAAQAAAGVFRQQAGEIASEVLSAMGEVVPVSVALVVEDAPLQRVVENGFLEALAGQGVAVHEAGGFAEPANTLRVLVLEQNASFDSLGLPSGVQGRRWPGTGDFRPSRQQEQAGR
jgi:hypothetical protein